MIEEITLGDADQTYFSTLAINGLTVDDDTTSQEDRIELPYSCSVHWDNPQVSVTSTAGTVYITSKLI